ncbi:hypothetical protein ACA910_016443 [Epithemia clementina (nom. ined.)]
MERLLSGFESDMSVFGRGRRLIDGHLVNDPPPGRTQGRRRFYYGRLWFFVVLFVILMGTNPANQELLDRFPRSWKSAGASYQPSSEMEWGDYAQKLYKAYHILTTEDDSLHASSMITASKDGNGPLVNFWLFSARLVTKRNQPRLQFLGAGQNRHCYLKKSRVCRLVHDLLLLPRNPTLRRCSRNGRADKLDKKLQDLDTLLKFQEPQQRRYYRAYHLLLGWIFWGLILTLVTNPTAQHQHPLVEAMTRGFWPNPHRPFSSTVVAFLDLWLFLAPALAVMDEQVSSQSQKSMFRLTKEDSELNYAFAVGVFLLLSSGLGNVISFTLSNWNNLHVSLFDPGRSAAAPVARSGYCCDVWAASALGYLRAFCREDSYSNVAYCIPLFGGGNQQWLQVTIVSAIWIRIAFQLLVVNESFSYYLFSSMGLWLTSDTIGNVIGEYQAEHHFALVALSNFIEGVDRFFGSLFGGVW